MSLSWVFLSNETDIELAMRFFWCTLLAVLGHRVMVLDGEIGGSFYFKVVSFGAIMTMLIFVVTGKTKNELKIWFNIKFNDNRDAQKAKIYSISDGTDG